MSLPWNPCRQACLRISKLSSLRTLGPRMPSKGVLCDTVLRVQVYRGGAHMCAPILTNSLLGYMDEPDGATWHTRQAIYQYVSPKRKFQLSIICLFNVSNLFKFALS